MAKCINIKGQKFGRLRAIEYMYTEKGKSSNWMCYCECGNKTTADIASLRNGNTKSCGCLRLEKQKESVIKHYKSHTSEYYAWGNMVQRCTNLNHPEYKNYGARGIVVYPEWRNSFETFYQDMGQKPDKKYSLDRIDNEEGYCKENCRWTDSFTQAVNKRDIVNKTVGIKNISYSQRDSLYCVAIERKGVRYRKSFKKIDDAIKWKEETLKNV